MTTRLGMKDDLFDAQLLRAAAASSYGGAQLGECLATAARIRGSDLDQWYEQWTSTADAAWGLGEAAEARGDRVAAREAFLRACTYYRTGGGMLLGAPLDPRLVASNSRQTAAFRRGAALLDSPPEVIEIPYEGTTLPGYFFRAGPAERRPTVILTDGYDGSVEELYFLTGAAALERGYNVLAFDGPGQGGALIQQGLTLRPDWENVVAPVVDYALARPDVDPHRLVLVGLSLGGHLAPRAASGEPRLAACIADCGSFDIFESVLARMPGPLATRLRAGEGAAESVVRPLLHAQMRRPTGGWALRRMQLVHGVDDPVELLNALREYTLADRAADIRCPTFVCTAEGDDISASAPRLYAELGCEKEFVTFTAAEGGGDHCETGARARYLDVSFAWLERMLR